uniref:Glial cell line-derived neurotrophic factor n=2 Tax=Callithrix jacchus TaxID=9483 RepID=F7I2A6_CALJA
IQSLPNSNGAAAGRDSKMKLWDVVAVCLVLLHTASAFPLPAGKRPLEAPAEDRSLGRRRAPFALSSDSNMPEDYPDQFDDVMDFIQATIKRLKRSPDKQMAELSRRERNREAAAANPANSKGKGQKGHKSKNRGCVLTAIHLNVTDLGLGYETKEALIFRYCSGSCDAAETTYDKILKNLSRNKKLVSNKVGKACCRPIAFDDDLSFLDDNLVYHILKKHSAKRCGCI